MRYGIVAILAAFTLAACATSPEAPSGAPTLVIAPGAPAPAQSRFYADCISQAAGANSYDREANVLRFHCSGAVAQRFFEGLANWSTQIGSQYEAEGVMWRFTSTIRENPSFVDFCRRTTAQAYDCTIVLNVGAFLTE